MKETNLFRLLAEAAETGRSAALVTVVSAEGSTPRELGAKMIVYENGDISGTVGGGKLEALSIREAQEALKQGTGRKVVLDLKPDGVGMICMGRVEIFVDVFVQDMRLFILGAGHVGEKIAEASALAGIPYFVADDRPEFANRERFPHAAQIFVERPDSAVQPDRVNGKTYVVIVTRGHALDQECLEAALKTPASYIGMIGSRSKVQEVFANLNRKGLHPEKDPRVFSPVGLDLGGKSPGAIAVSVLAEILKLKNKRSADHLRLALSETHES